MKKKRHYGWAVLVLVALISSLGGVLGNIASGILPDDWKPYLWLAWPLFFTTIVLGILISIWQSRMYQQNGEYPNSLALPSNAKRNVDWSGAIPDPKLSYDREQELLLMQQFVFVEKCSLVGIIGVAGVGKTNFAAKFVQVSKNKFEYIFWRSLRNAPPLKDVLRECILFLSDQEETNLPDDEQSLKILLIGYLNKHRCLIVLDNAETVIGDTSRPPQMNGEVNNFNDLLNLVSASSRQSCTVITAREKSRQFSVIEDKRGVVKSITLKGLSAGDGRKILEDKGVNGTDNAFKYLVEYYSGNPLALKLIAESIHLYNNNIDDFINKGSLLSFDTQELLGQQFDRLLKTEKSIMFWLAIKRESTTISELVKDAIQPTSIQSIQDAMENLSRHSLVEVGEYGISLQNFILEFVTNRLVDLVAAEIQEGNIDIFASHSLIQAQAKDHIRQSQIRMVLNPITENLTHVFKSSDALSRHLMELIKSFQKHETQEFNYLAGNVLNLLVYAKCDLTGFDFSKLTIWQAYLKDVDLHDVNLTFCGIGKSVFAETYSGFLSIDISPNNNLLATGTTNGDVQVWQLNDSKLLNICSGHTDWIRALAFSKDNHLLASGSEDQTIRLWDVETGICTKVLQGHTGWVWSVAFNADSTLLASTGPDGTLRLWDVESGFCIKTLHGHANWIWQAVFSPDGYRLASASADNTIKLWDVASGNLISTFWGHSKPVTSVAFSPDGKTLISGSEDETIRLWDVDTINCILVQKDNSIVKTVAFSADGRLIASGNDDKTIRLWNSETLQAVQTLHGHSNQIRKVVFSFSSQMLASVSSDHTVGLWDVSNGYSIRFMRGVTNLIRTMAINPVDNTLASSGMDRTIRFWDTTHGNCINVFRENANRVWSIAFSPEGKRLAVATDDNFIRIWDVKSGQNLHVLRGHTKRACSVGFDPTGKILASGGEDQSVKIWDLQSGKCLKTLEGHNNWIWSVSFNSSGLLASAGDDKIIRLWDINKSELIKELPGHLKRIWSLAFNGKGNILASASEDGNILLWDMSTFASKILAGHTSWVLSVTFSPRDLVLASGGADNTIRVWDLATNHCIRTLNGHTSRVRSVAYSSDGSFITSGSEDGTIRFWDSHTGECFKTLKNLRIYEGMNVSGVSGITEAEFITLKELGAIEI